MLMPVLQSNICVNIIKSAKPVTLLLLRKEMCSSYRGVAVNYNLCKY
jgi:hypothetical protein